LAGGVALPDSLTTGMELYKIKGERNYEQEIFTYTNYLIMPVLGLSLDVISCSEITLVLGNLDGLFYWGYHGKGSYPTHTRARDEVAY
jgi:hypothetical protein